MGYFGARRLSQPERSRVAPGKWSVYDYDAGMIARRGDGKLAYFETRREAKEWRDSEVRKDEGRA